VAFFASVVSPRRNHGGLRLHRTRLAHSADARGLRCGTLASRSLAGLDVLRCASDFTRRPEGLEVARSSAGAPLLHPRLALTRGTWRPSLRTLGGRARGARRVSMPSSRGPERAAARSQPASTTRGSFRGAPVISSGPSGLPVAFLFPSAAAPIASSERDAWVRPRLHFSSRAHQPRSQAASTTRGSDRGCIFSSRAQRPDRNWRARHAGPSAEHPLISSGPSGLPVAFSLPERSAPIATGEHDARVLPRSTRSVFFRRVLPLLPASV
jgi:hypothetical protein